MSSYQGSGHLPGIIIVILLHGGGVSGLYRKILHEYAKYFPEPKARENTAHEYNVSRY